MAHAALPRPRRAVDAPASSGSSSASSAGGDGGGGGGGLDIEAMLRDMLHNLPKTLSGRKAALADKLGMLTDAQIEQVQQYVRQHQGAEHVQALDQAVAVVRKRRKATQAQARSRKASEVRKSVPDAGSLREARQLAAWLTPPPAG